MKDTSFYQNLPPISRNETDEVQHTIRGVTTGTAVATPAILTPAGGTRLALAQADATQIAFRADRTPPFPPPPALEPEPPGNRKYLFF